jgi:hypothetical protein
VPQNAIHIELCLRKTNGNAARPKMKHGGQARNGVLPKRYAQAKFI